MEVVDKRRVVKIRRWQSGDDGSIMTVEWRSSVGNGQAAKSQTATTMHLLYWQWWRSLLVVIASNNIIGVVLVGDGDANIISDNKEIILLEKRISSIPAFALFD
ncbi:hypothetical protein KFK09_025409 [Dendrobium nobile]|uniref:Uncharacterized protein n=1 Tax=Dendrobium nobile TaxID=94219 RepID=A0A8T3AGA8_DENNO|nr:hypothetical protein KFK09_025409 [Dendrobium nobile]